MLKKLIISTMAIVALAQSVSADDYLLYGTWNIGGHTNIYDIEGFIDTNGTLGTAGDEYVIFNSGSTGYIYRVDVNGDPNMHPDNPNPSLVGNIAPRTFTFVSKSAPNALQSGGGADEFYVDDTGIYFGSGRGIKRWDFNWSNVSNVVGYGLYSQTLARNKTTGEWWTTTSNRTVYKYDNNTSSWQYQFTYPDLGGDHHDGMEISGPKLYLSDMTSDKIIVYDLNSTGSVENPSTNYHIYSYTASPYVEGMGYGPNQHFWMSAGPAYEVGDGNITTECTQTFNYGTKWTMYRSDCDNMKVPGFDDTIMAKMVGDKLQFATADAGAKAWLEGLDCNITVLNQLTLNTGDGFWTVGKSDINKTISSGENRNKSVTLHDGVYSFIGFNVSVDLYDKFGTKPVEAIYYYDGSWKTWKPEDGNQVVNAGQGLYVLPNGDFSILLK